MSKVQFGLPHFQKVSAIGALASFSVGSYALIRGDVNITIVASVLTLMMIVAHGQVLNLRDCVVAAANDNSRLGLFERLRASRRR
jgi:hypothetical protein